MDAVVAGVSADEGVVVDNDIAAALSDTFGIEAPAPAVVEDPAPGTPAAPEVPAPTVVETPESEEGDSGVAEATPAEQMAKLLDEAGGEAMKLDPETVPEELRPFLKNFQADYTRKTQAIAESRKKSAEELAADEVADLRRQVEELRTQPAAPVAPVAAPVPPETPDLVAQITASVEREHGKMLTFEEAMADENPASLQRYIKQQGVFEARMAQAEMAARFAPVVQETRQAVNASKQAEAQAEWEAVITATPKAAEYEGEIAALLTVPDGQGGFRYTLKQAADLVLAQTSKDADVQSAMALGMKAGEQRARQVAANKDNFAVPSASTAPKGGPTFAPTMSLEDIGLAAVQDL